MSIQEEIKFKLEKELPGSSVVVVNESSEHIGHDAGGAHLGVTVIYQGFLDKSIVEQHQMVYKALKEEMKEKIHALVIKTKVQ